MIVFSVGSTAIHLMSWESRVGCFFALILSPFLLVPDDFIPTPHLLQHDLYPLRIPHFLPDHSGFVVLLSLFGFFCFLLDWLLTLFALMDGRL